MSSLPVAFALLVGSAMLIYLACEYFVNGVEWVGRRLSIGSQATGTVLAAFGTALPFVEGALGLLLVLGLFTRAALVGAMLVIMSLVFGSSLLEKWPLVGDQLVYGLYIITLVLHLQRNRLCLDAVTPTPAT